MGILKIKDNVKPTGTLLKEIGFEQIPWGAPCGRYKNGKAKWDKSHKCWELFDNTDGYWNGDLVYFPAGFNGYVTMFQGDWTGTAPKHPAGFAYITIDNRDDGWFKIVKINDIEDIHLAIAIMRDRINELNKSVFRL